MPAVRKVEWLEDVDTDDVDDGFESGLEEREDFIAWQISQGISTTPRQRLSTEGFAVASTALDDPKPGA